ncbi:glycosyltransferase family 2 protein [Mycobacterium crocinum]|uniref:Glycosyltransferase n=1 Tax=Mycolicibacterium crocinum TaxID=388459 RepID=A0ABY3TNJ5_9MYCO|nr:glycosyltransferase family 2 protein [Mycolicibacterium crocinum]MCV7215610.1 glycosyltransferase family 2 protein [Mycolicibacterium crocinum]ULN43035.1 glycosyltransferase [Mycolicibacterium crocinum]
MTPGQQTSFVIASRNRAAELTLTMARLLDTTPCRIVLVDNASEDDSVHAARRVAAGSGGRVQIIELDRNLGAPARNIGVAACGTPYVAFCDDDSWWAPDAPATAEAIFAGHPPVGLLAAKTVVLPQRTEDPLVHLLASSPLGTRPGLPGPSILGFLACSSIVRAEAFCAAGGFSPVLHFRGEEQLLALDMARLGWELCYCSELVAVHQPSQTRPTSAAQDARSLRNDVLTTWMRRPLPHCLRAGGRLLQAALRDVEHTRAAAEALVRLPAAIAQRRPLPATLERDLRILETG